jgi:hypothetical protein
MTFEEDILELDNLAEEYVEFVAAATNSKLDEPSFEAVEEEMLLAVVEDLGDGTALEELQFFDSDVLQHIEGGIVVEPSWEPVDESCRHLVELDTLDTFVDEAPAEIASRPLVLVDSAKLGLLELEEDTLAEQEEKQDHIEDPLVCNSCQKEGVGKEHKLA